MTQNEVKLTKEQEKYIELAIEPKIKNKDGALDILYYFNERGNQTFNILAGLAGLWLTFCCSRMLNIYKKTGLKALWINFVLGYIAIIGGSLYFLLVFIDTRFV